MDLSKLTRKQPPNRRVVLATLPCIAGGVYFFGWRSLAMVLVCMAVAYLAEWLFCRKRGEIVSEAAFVTAAIYSIILPPTLPWHVLVVGILVAIVVTKELFGGFGRNVFNPAMVGRAFIYVCFPVAMTGTWAPNALELRGAQWYGALNRWTTQRLTGQELAGLRAGVDAQRWTIAREGPDGADATTGATPLGVNKQLQQEIQRRGAAGGAELGAAVEDFRQYHQRELNYGDLLLGRISGVMGGTSALLILIGGMYLYMTNTASRAIILSTVISCTALSELLHVLGVRPSSDALTALLSGGFLFGAFFMATDPITAPKTFWGRIYFGCIVGTGRVIIANHSVFNGGFMFALLLGNTFGPTIDYLVRARQEARKAKPTAPTTPTGEVTAP